MIQLWTITDMATGQVLCPAYETPGFGSHPKDHGWAWVAGAQTAKRIDSRPDEHSMVWDGAGWVDDLGETKRLAVQQVNEAAETFRQCFITPGAGQAVTYMAKEAEARAWTSGSDPASFPFLACEAENIGKSIDEVAAVALAMADYWRPIGVAIEGRRQGALQAIAAAASRDDIAAAAAVDWAALVA